jgi:SAM-dependent methyltransferase
MKHKTVAYTSDYFECGIFETDYQTLASVIVELYHPKTVVEFGCGPGHLSRELSKLGVLVTAVDGYCQPNFSRSPIEFHTLDLNDAVAISNYFEGKSFDLAISLEVAEHLQPESSSTLVEWLAKVAPIVVFSAGVLGQGGHGHINLRPRDYWHKEFTRHGFVVADRVREKLRPFTSVAPWYRHNVIDYIYAQHPQAPSLNDVIPRLIASESAASTAYYQESDRRFLVEVRLQYAPVQWYLKLRQLAKRLLGRG